MFTIGLEMKLENLMQMRKQVFVLVLYRWFLSIAFYPLSHYLFGLDFKASIVIGGALFYLQQ